MNDFGGSPISEAAGLGYVDLVKYLLSVGATLQIPEQKESVLHAAVRSGSAEMVKVILNAGAAVNNVETLNQTALHVAAEDDHVEIVRLLLEAGADPTAKRMATRSVHRSSRRVVKLEPNGTIFGPNQAVVGVYETEVQALVSNL